MRAWIISQDAKRRNQNVAPFGVRERVDDAK